MKYIPVFKLTAILVAANSLLTLVNPWGTVLSVRLSALGVAVCLFVAAWQLKSIYGFWFAGWWKVTGNFIFLLMDFIFANEAVSVPLYYREVNWTFCTLFFDLSVIISILHVLFATLKVRSDIQGKLAIPAS